MLNLTLGGKGVDGLGDGEVGTSDGEDDAGTSDGNC